MVTLTPPQQRRLTVQVQTIGPDTTAVRSLDWDRDRFDIEFGLQNGTTYNSFLIKGDRVALVDTSHEKFHDLYFQRLEGLIDLTQIDYLVISHTEPDHSGLVRAFLEQHPEVTVVGSKVAIQFLENLVHRPFKRQLVKSGDTLDLGYGHRLEFVSAPNLHWPDTIFTYDHGTGILFTCDAFGMHYCSDALFDEDVAAIESDFRYYYDCLMGPNARSVLGALKRMADLGPLSTIATGHGPLLQHHLPLWLESYRTWSEANTQSETTVAVFYVAGYGDSDRQAQAIAHGLTKTGVAVEMVDLKTADLHELQDLAGRAAGLVMGTFPMSGPVADQARTALSTILAAVHPKQGFGVFEAGGSDDEAVYPLANRLSDVGLTAAFPPLRRPHTDTEALYQTCEEAGTDLGQWVTRDRTIRHMKALDSELDKALGRLSGGLYIITARKGDRSSAMLASWVAQASFKPLGVTIAVAKDRAIEALMQVGDGFVLNVLEEGNAQPLMKHFLKRFAPGGDRFAGIATQPSQVGAPILTDALAYLECEVVSRMECSDHWLVYSVVKHGRVAKADGLTAVHHRKVGNHY